MPDRTSILILIALAVFAWLFICGFLGLSIRIILWTAGI